MKKLIFGFVLIAVASGSRVLLNRMHIAVNVELVTVSTLLAAVYLGKSWSILVPVASMALSDRIIGNTSIYLFTWSAFAIIGLLSLTHNVLAKFILCFSKASVQVDRLFAVTLLAIFSSLFFYLWTNFGVWYQGWYAPTWQGLARCYFMGLPFLKYNLIGNLVLVPLGFGLVEVAFNELPRLTSSRKISSYE